MNRTKSLLLVLSSLLLLFTKGNAQEQFSAHPKNEFRAVWIATVANIDWPTTNTDSVEKQQKDFIAILETYKKLNYNVI